MFPLIRLALQFGLNQHLLNDKASCRKFLLNLVAVLKPMAEKTKTEIDDKLLLQLEYILKNDVLFDYFYKLIADQFATDEILFAEADESEVTALVEQAPLPEAINPVVIISLVTQIISLINAIKNIKLN